MSLRETKNAPFSTKSKKCENFAKKICSHEKCENFAKPFPHLAGNPNEVYGRYESSKAKPTGRILDEYSGSNIYKLPLDNNKMWVRYRVHQNTGIQGVSEYRDTGCTRIQGYWVHQDTGMQCEPEYMNTGYTRIQGYWVHQDTGMHCAPEYMDTG